MKTTAENQEIYKTEALLQFALMHGDEDEAAPASDFELDGCFHKGRRGRKGPRGA